MVPASWLRATEESTKIRRVEEKLAEGYVVLMIPAWKLLDEQGNVKEISIEPQKSSGRRPWRRSLIKDDESTRKQATEVIVSLSAAYYEKPSPTEKG